MATKKAPRSTKAKHASLSNLLQLQYDFVLSRLAKAKASSPSSGSIARTNSENFPGFDKLMKKLDCIRTENAIEHSATLLANNWNNLTTAQQDEGVSTLTDVVNQYAEECSAD